MRVLEKKTKRSFQHIFTAAAAAAAAGVVVVVLVVMVVLLLHTHLKHYAAHQPFPSSVVEAEKVGFLGEQLLVVPLEPVLLQVIR